MVVATGDRTNGTAEEVGLLRRRPLHCGHRENKRRTNQGTFKGLRVW